MEGRSMALSSRGESRIGTLIYILVAILVIYIVIKVVPPYMHYYAMDDEVEQQAKMSRINDADTIREDLMKKADELGIYIDPQFLNISYNDKHVITIDVAWAEEVDFGYGITRDFQFEIKTTGTALLDE
jgi:hypothetical protein